MIELLKRLARKLPLIRPVLEDRAALRIRNEELRAENQRLQHNDRGITEELWAAKQQLQDELVAKDRELEMLRRLQGFAPPGHFYSPIPEFEAASELAAKVFDSAGTSVPAIARSARTMPSATEALTRYPQSPLVVSPTT